jgi:hypothetical protein
LFNLQANARFAVVTGVTDWRQFEDIRELKTILDALSERPAMGQLPPILTVTGE